MNIHEYQAKMILAQNGFSVPDGKIAYTPNEAKRVALQLSSRGPWVLKAQIQSGAREKGHFISHEAGHKGGIRVVTQLSNIAYEANQMLNNVLVTEQTGPQGKLVSKIYVENFSKTIKTFYAGMVIDSAVSSITLLVSNEINKDIINLSASDYTKILRINIFPKEDITQLQVERIADFLDLESSYYPELAKFMQNLLNVFVNLDAKMIEINPVGITKNKEFVAMDAKISIDDNALYRHRDIARLRDDYEEDERVLQAHKYGFQYHEFDGNIGCIVNGDGLALEAMDMLQAKGFSTACTLNVKGGVDKDKIAAGIKIIMTNPRVEGILINILGGFLRCNLVADGILAATEEIGLTMPMVVRLEGTNKNDAKNILQNSNLAIVFAQDTQDAIQKMASQMQENV